MGKTCSDPFFLFETWFEQARMSEIHVANAATLASVDEKGYPDARVVLIKDILSEKGFVFYTNLQSPKAQHIQHCPHVCLCFFWKSLGKQVRIWGKASPVEAEVADAYFATRSRSSQIGAWASRQSLPIPEGSSLDTEMRIWEEKFRSHTQIPRPSFWSGYTLLPHKMEFWEEGAHRLHKRVVFERGEGHDGWISYSAFP